MSKDAKRSPLWPALALIVVALSIAGWYVEEHQHARATSAEAAREATEWVRAGFEAGDAVRVEPAWDDGPWSALQGTGKGTERFPFPALLRGDAVDPVELLRHRRLWVLYTQDTDEAPPVAEALGDVEERRDFAPGVSAVRYAVKPADLRARMSESLEEVRVSRHPAGSARIDCPRRGQRFDCGGKAWMNVRVETRDVDHLEASWLYAHPGPVEAELRLLWAPKREADAMLLRVGHTLEAVRRERGRPATITVQADGAEVDSFTLERHTYTHERRLYAWEPGAPPGEWTLSVRSQDADWREVLLDADLLGEIPSAMESGVTARVSVPRP